MSAIWAATSTGFDLETIKTAALGISGASLIIGLILMKVVSNVVGKVVSLVVFVAIALAGYSQRASIVDCANKVQAEATTISTETPEATCNFFGQEITLKIPQTSK
jgi:hypothetical protein